MTALTTQVTWTPESVRVMFGLSAQGDAWDPEDLPFSISPMGDTENTERAGWLWEVVVHAADCTGAEQHGAMRRQGRALTCHLASEMTFFEATILISDYLNSAQTAQDRSDITYPHSWRKRDYDRRQAQRTARIVLPAGDITADAASW